MRLSVETIAPGVALHHEVRSGSATAIATGGMLPRGADAVVMIEHTDYRDGELRLSRPVSPGANISFAGTDIGRGEVILRRGERLTSRETGVLAALGLGRRDRRSPAACRYRLDRRRATIAGHGDAAGHGPR